MACKCWGYPCEHGTTLAEHATAPAKAILLADLRDIAETCDGDPEAAHIQADAALLAYVDDDEIKAAYEALERWYA